MDCIFKGLNTARCLSCRKCVGLEQLVLELGGSAEFARSFSQYGFLRSFLNKLEDRKFESLAKLLETRKKNTNTTQKSHRILFLYHLESKLCKIGQKIIGNPFQVEGAFRKIENKFFTSEFSTTITTINFFESAGEGYAFFFYYAALGATKSLHLARLFADYGKFLGALVCLRDGFKDLKSDRRRGKFNPFLTWSNAKIKEFYVTYTKELQNKLLHITQQIFAKTKLKLSFLTTPTQFSQHPSDQPSQSIQPIQPSQSSHTNQSIPSEQFSHSSCSIKDPKTHVSVMDSLSMYIFSKQSLCARFVRRTLIPTPRDTSNSSKLMNVGRKIGTLLSISALATVIPGVAAAPYAESGGCCDSCLEACCSPLCDSCNEKCNSSCDTCCDNCCDSMCDSCSCNSNSNSTSTST